MTYQAVEQQTVQFEKQTITFIEPLPGFEDLHEFVLVPCDSRVDNQFYFLQSVENPAIRLLVVSPFLFLPEYEIKLSQSLIQSLCVEKTEDVIVLTVVVARNPLENSTTNLKAPIIINSKNRLAYQYIIDDRTLDLRYPLFKKSLAIKEGAGC